VTITTLSTAKAANDLTITLASAAGVKRGMLALIGAERLRITRVDQTPTIGVVPGADGTQALAHLARTPVAFGLPSEFTGTRYVNSSLSLTGPLLVFDDIGTSGKGLPAIRAAVHLVGQTAAVPAITTYTPLVDTTLNSMVSILITTTAAENFTIFVSYTDTGGTARVATLPLRLLTGVNVLIVNFANGAIPYAGVTQQFRAKAGTLVTVGTAGAIGGAVYDCSAVILDSQI